MKQFLKINAPAIFAILGFGTYAVMLIGIELKLVGYLDWSWGIILSPLWVCTGIIFILIIIYHVWNAYLKYIDRQIDELNIHPSPRRRYIQGQDGKMIDVTRHDGS